MYEPHYNQLDCLLEFFPYRYTLYVMVQQKAHLGAGITGSSLHPRVLLPAVTGRWGIDSLVLSFWVGGVFAESQWREPWRRLRVPFSV